MSYHRVQSGWLANQNRARACIPSAVEGPRIQARQDRCRRSVHAHLHVHLRPTSQHDKVASWKDSPRLQPASGVQHLTRSVCQHRVWEGKARKGKGEVLTYALVVHGRHVLSLQFWHSYMNECGPEWHMLQFQRMRVVSDLIILKLCWQFAGAAMAK